MADIEGLGLITGYLQGMLLRQKEEEQKQKEQEALAMQKQQVEIQNLQVMLRNLLAEKELKQREDELEFRKSIHEADERFRKAQLDLDERRFEMEKETREVDKEVKIANLEMAKRMHFVDIANAVSVVVNRTGNVEQAFNFFKGSPEGAALLEKLHIDRPEGLKAFLDKGAIETKVLNYLASDVGTKPLTEKELDAKETVVRQLGSDMPRETIRIFSNDIRANNNAQLKQKIMLSQLGVVGGGGRGISTAERLGDFVKAAIDYAPNAVQLSDVQDGVQAMGIPLGRKENPALKTHTDIFAEAKTSAESALKGIVPLNYRDKVLPIFMASWGTNYVMRSSDIILGVAKRGGAFDTQKVHERYHDVWSEGLRPIVKLVEENRGGEPFYRAAIGLITELGIAHNHPTLLPNTAIRELKSRGFDIDYGMETSVAFNVLALAALNGNKQAEIELKDALSLYRGEMRANLSMGRAPMFPSISGSSAGFAGGVAIPSAVQPQRPVPRTKGEIESMIKQSALYIRNQEKRKQVNIPPKGKQSERRR